MQHISVEQDEVLISTRDRTQSVEIRFRDGSMASFTVSQGSGNGYTIVAHPIEGQVASFSGVGQDFIGLQLTLAGHLYGDGSSIPDEHLVPDRLTVKVTGS